MEAVIEFGKLIIPAALVLYAMYLTVRVFINKELDKARVEIRGKSIETILPNRIHAYERICLFLERISPNNLLVRLSTGKYSAQELQQILLNEIREEYNHNVSQQIYMSEEVWELVRNAKEELIITINEAARSLPPDANGTALSKHVFGLIVNKKVDPIAHALKEVKDEIRQTF